MNSLEYGTRQATTKTGIAVVTKTDHFAVRQVQRGVSNEMVRLALRHGLRFYEGANQVYFLGRRQVPTRVDHRVAERANGTVVVACGDRLVTTYRNPLYVRKLKRRDH